MDNLVSSLEVLSSPFQFVSVEDTMRQRISRTASRKANRALILDYIEQGGCDPVEAARLLPVQASWEKSGRRSCICPLRALLETCVYLGYITDARFLRVGPYPLGKTAKFFVRTLFGALGAEVSTRASARIAFAIIREMERKNGSTQERAAKAFAVMRDAFPRRMFAKQESARRSRPQTSISSLAGVTS